MNKFISEKIDSLAPSATIAMNQKASDMRDQGYDIIDLSLGEPDFFTPVHIQHAAKDAIDSQKYFHYPPVGGYKDLREAIAKKFRVENNIHCNTNNIVVSNGAKQSLTNIFECIINPGDEVIVYTPYWVSYKSTLDLCGAKLVPLFGVPENGFEPTHKMLEEAVTSKTKAILFASPSNPTGHVLSETYLRGMSEVLKKYPNIIAVSDEIYEHINFYNKSFSLGSIREISDRVVTINGVSKAYAMTGWRIGYLTAHEDLAKACIKLQGQTTSAACGISQRAALAAILGNTDEVQHMAERYKMRCFSLLSRLRQSTLLNIIEPRGAFYLFCSMERYLASTYRETIHIKNANDFCMYLIEYAHVSVVASDGFGMSNYIRISYATADELLDKAAERIAEALSKLKLADSR
jgi:aspartate aminotransferase